VLLGALFHRARISEGHPCERWAVRLTGAVETSDDAFRTNRRESSASHGLFRTGTCIAGVASAATITQNQNARSHAAPATATQTFCGFVPGTNGVPIGTVLVSVADTFTIP